MKAMLKKQLGGLPAAERVRLLRDLVGSEVRAVTPKLLAESR